MTPQQQLIQKYLEGLASEEERTELEYWYASIQAPLEHLQNEEEIGARINKQIVKAIGSDIPVAKKFKLNVSIYSAAAAILLVAGFVFLFNHQKPIGRNALLDQDIAPGGNQAILTLANGQQISLDTAADGKLLRLAGLQIEKKNGAIIYGLASTNAQPIRFNTLSTPKGAKYEVVLPDGTHVWLNALSSIRYPEAFGTTQRTVEIHGEAYFEVAHQLLADGKTRMPFLVYAGNEIIEVLGTHFNVHQYEDDPSQLTTLLEGAVKIYAFGASVSIKPGEAAGLIKGEQGIQKFSTVNTELAVAWKNGVFQFEEATVPEILSQVARWYDVEIVYQGKISQERFSGKVSREENLSEILEILKRGGIRFKIDERKIIVY